MELKPLSLVFFGLVFFSFLFHAYRRLDHFQECDSTSVYDSLYHFPQSGHGYLKGCYYVEPNKPAAARWANTPTVLAWARNWRPELSPHELTQILSNPMRSIRIGMIAFTTRIQPYLPFSIQSALALPLSSTYSPGAGFFYGLFNSRTATHAEFMSGSLILTLVLFHCSVVLVWLVCQALGVGLWAATVAALWMLFSISGYSYGYHLGSTVWNVFASSLWVYFFTRRCSGKLSLSLFSWITAGLFLMSYLLLPLWVASAFYEMGKTLATSPRRTRYKALFFTLSALLPAAVSLGLVILLFVQPSAGVNTSIISVFPGARDSFYIVANFLAFFPTRGNAYLSAVFLAVLGGSALLKRTQSPRYFWLYVGALALTITAMSFRQMFALTPSRHALFLTPFVFSVIALGLDGVFSKLGGKIAPAALVLTIAAGSLGVAVRAPSTFSAIDWKSVEVALKQWPVQTMGIYGCSHDLKLRSWGTPVSTQWVGEPVSIGPGRGYAQLSQLRPLQEAEFAGLQAAAGPRVRLVRAVEMSRSSSTYFIAFNPDPGRFLHHTPNGFHFTLLTAKEGTQ